MRANKVVVSERDVVNSVIGTDTNMGEIGIIGVDAYSGYETVGPFESDGEAAAGAQSAYVSAFPLTWERGRYVNDVLVTGEQHF